MLTIEDLIKEPDPKDMQALWNLCKYWICKHQVACPESIYQRDDVSLSVYELVEEICETVGYFDDHEDE